MGRKLVGAAPSNSLDAITRGYGDNTYIDKGVVGAKGDIVIGTAAGTPDILPVGTDGHVVIADSAETSGLRWGPAGRYIINAQTGTTYTPVLSDESKLVTFDNTGAITVTLPQNSVLAFPIGGWFNALVINTGMVTFAAGAGATVNGTPSLVTVDRWSAVTVIKISTNGWVVVGRLV